MGDHAWTFASFRSCRSRPLACSRLCSVVRTAHRTPPPTMAQAIKARIASSRKPSRCPLAENSRHLSRPIPAPSRLRERGCYPLWRGRTRAVLPVCSPRIRLHVHPGPPGTPTAGRARGAARYRRPIASSRTADGGSPAPRARSGEMKHGYSVDGRPCTAPHADTILTSCAGSSIS